MSSSRTKCPAAPDNERRRRNGSPRQNERTVSGNLAPVLDGTAIGTLNGAYSWPDAATFMKSLADAPEARLLVDRLRHVTPQSVRRWGRMSAQEMVCHLADAYRHGMGEIAPSPVDTVLTRNVIKPFALWFPMRWPPGYPTRPEVDPQRAGRKPGDFGRDRDQVETDMYRFIAAVHRGTMAKHAIFGPMSGREWLRWGWLHADHHLRQFSE